MLQYSHLRACERRESARADRQVDRQFDELRGGSKIVSKRETGARFNPKWPAGQ